MGILNKVSVAIATLGPIGYLPAPGTWGTLCAVPILYALRSFYDLSAVLIIVAAFTLLAFAAVHYALPSFGGHDDPSHIVIDEFIGFAALACAIPLKPVLFGAGFLLFRFFDIIKPLGIKRVERLHGVFGIMCDDLVAAFYAGLCVQSFVYSLHYLNLY
jgi:phosphatidylglycerophosphatase A